MQNCTRVRSCSFIEKKKVVFKGKYDREREGEHRASFINLFVCVSSFESQT